MRIPERFIYTGDKAKAITLKGVGRRCLEKHKEFLGFRQLPSGKSKPYAFPGGATIRCATIFGCHEVHINVPHGGGKAICRECLCYPHFAIALILKAYPEEPTTSELHTGRFTYDILICGKTFYMLYEDAYDANFGRYEKGQIVLATIGQEMEEWESPLDCQRDCLTQPPRFQILAISPIFSVGLMTEWMYADD